jgi:7-cyano-7-deazaguanine reductase
MATSKLKALGESARKNKNAYHNNTKSPQPHLLETIPTGSALLVSIDAPEFTCLCPITKQPDYAHITITYQPDALSVESKSLKLYLGSFRSVGMFHEAVAHRIANDLYACLKPRALIVKAHFSARGGIAYTPVAVRGMETADLAKVMGS